MLTVDGAKEAMKTAIEGMLVELELGSLVVTSQGASMEYVAAIPAQNPAVFGVAYLFVSQDEGQQIELMRRISGFLATGLPDMAQRQP